MRCTQTTKAPRRAPSVERKWGWRQAAGVASASGAGAAGAVVEV
jgi:hypothetical protein